MDEYTRLEPVLLDAINGAAIDEERFLALARAVHRFQRRHNRHFDEYCAFLGAPDEPGDWRDIPAVPQSIFKRYPLQTFPAEQTVKTFRTSGTTGEGRGEHHFRSLALYEASILRGWDLLELPPLPQLILSQQPAAAPHSSLVHMLATLAGRAPEQHYCIDAAGALQTEQIASIIGRYSGRAEPVLLMGTALAFLHLLEQSPAIPLPLASFILETGGYKGSGRTLSKPEFHGRLSEYFLVPPERILNEYSMTELSSQFYTRGLGNPHAGPPWTRAVVVDAERGGEVAPGETGLIKIIDLANLGTVLAIQTQDLAIRRENGFELLGRDPAALPRGCSRAADELLSSARQKSSHS